MSNIKDYLWLIKTNKGDFFMTVIGNWTQEEAAKIVRGVFEIVLKLGIIGMIPRKRATGPIEATGTIYEQEEPKDELGFSFLAGKKIWEACNRGVEYEAKCICLKAEMG